MHCVIINTLRQEPESDSATTGNSQVDGKAWHLDYIIRSRAVRIRGRPIAVKRGISGFTHTGKDLIGTTLAGNVLKCPVLDASQPSCFGETATGVVAFLSRTYCERHRVRR